MSIEAKIPFNKWSEDRIKNGQKVCTSRSKKYGLPGDWFHIGNARCRIQFIVELPLWFVKEFLWRQEGARSPEEFEEVWRSIHRGQFKAEKIVWVHFFFNPYIIPSMNERAWQEGI